MVTTILWRYDSHPHKRMQAVEATWPTLPHSSECSVCSSPERSDHVKRAPTPLPFAATVAMLTCVGGLTVLACVWNVGGFMFSFLLVSTCPFCCKRDAVGSVTEDAVVGREI